MLHNIDCTYAEHVMWRPAEHRPLIRDGFLLKDQLGLIEESLWVDCVPEELNVAWRELPKQVLEHNNEHHNNNTNDIECDDEVEYHKIERI